MELVATHIDQLTWRGQDPTVRFARERLKGSSSGSGDARHGDDGDRRPSEPVNGCGGVVLGLRPDWTVSRCSRRLFRDSFPGKCGLADTGRRSSALYSRTI